MLLRTSASIEELSFDFLVLVVIAMMFFLIMITPGIIVILVNEELDEHLLNVV